MHIKTTFGSLSRKDLSAMAKNLKSSLSLDGISIKHQNCLKHVLAVFGENNRDATLGNLKKQEKIQKKENSMSIWDISTTHLPSYILEWLGLDLSGWPTVYKHPNGYGIMVHVPTPEEVHTNFKLPKELKKILLKAAELEYDFIMFDRDAKPSELIEIFNWDEPIKDGSDAEYSIITVTLDPNITYKNLSDEDRDEAPLGIFYIQWPKDLDREDLNNLTENSLDIFHETFAIKVLDDFCFDICHVNGEIIIPDEATEII